MSRAPFRRAIAAGAAVLAGAVVVVTGVTVASGPATQAAPNGTAAQQALADRLDTILADPRLDGAQHDLTVRDLDTGTTLYDANGSTRLLPASNAKLLTSTAALDVLGPGYTFPTKVLGTGRDGSTVHGNLYLKGYGDPMATANTYDALAAQVAQAGIRTVDGSLVADATWFDDVPLAPFWAWDDEPYYYSAQTSALNVAPDNIGDTGTVLVHVRPASSAGAPAKITMSPPNSYLTIHDDATTGAAGSPETVSMVREHGRNVVDVTGSIPLGAAQYIDEPTFDNPPGLVAQLFARALARHDVHLAHSTPQFGATPDDAAALATHESEPLSAILTPFLKLSNNMIAEVLTKAMGRESAGAGTWGAGTAAILDDVRADGVDTDTVQLYDGSGLGRADYVPTDQIVTLLDHVRSKPWYADWYAALPIAGRQNSLVGGTLRHRMAGTPAAGNLHGKTGSMTGVSALSGYVTDAEGHHLAFSMISNNFVQGGITTLEDEVGVTLARYGGPDAASAPQLPPATRHVPAGPRAQLECSWTRSC